MPSAAPFCGSPARLAAAEGSIEWIGCSNASRPILRFRTFGMSSPNARGGAQFRPPDKSATWSLFALKRGRDRAQHLAFGGRQLGRKVARGFALLRWRLSFRTRLQLS